MVLAGLPISESGQFLGNSLEKADNDADRSRLHVMAELVNGRNVLRSRLVRFYRQEIRWEHTGTR